MKRDISMLSEVFCRTSAFGVFVRISARLLSLSPDLKWWSCSLIISKDLHPLTDISIDLLSNLAAEKPPPRPDLRPRLHRSVPVSWEVMCFLRKMRRHQGSVNWERSGEPTTWRNGLTFPYISTAIGHADHF